MDKYQQNSKLDTKKYDDNEVSITQDEKQGNSRKVVIISGIVGLVIIIAVITSLIAINRGDDGSGGAEGTENGQTVEENSDDAVNDSTQKMSTELYSGSVTTTIDGKSITYKAAYVIDGIDVTVSAGTYGSTQDDEVVFLIINGGSLKIEEGVTINKSGSADFKGRGDNYSFYGTNSAVVVVGEKSSAAIDGVTINTSVSGANAIVATDGGKVVIENSDIKTSMDNSRGLHATHGGSINADTVSIATKGGSSAPLATDRGSGTVIANNMTLSAEGAGSPLVYSTGDITVTNSTGTATGAQIAVVEGKNSISLQGCDFSTNGVGNRNGVDNAAVMIYQSMSGDASVGTGSFTATDCKLTVLPSSKVYTETPFFFVTNTEATIALTGVTASFSDEQVLVSAMGTDEWGKSGSNGGKVTLNINDTKATNTMVNIDGLSSISEV